MKILFLSAGLTSQKVIIAKSSSETFIKITRIDELLASFLDGVQTGFTDINDFIQIS